MNIKVSDYKIEVFVENELIAYLIYENLLHRYWAPIIHIQMIEVMNKYRRLGVGTLLVNELKKEFPKEIITLEIMEDSETNFDILTEFYSKLNFREIIDTGYGRILVYIPKGKTINDIKPIPEKILYKEIVMGLDTGYNLSHTWIDDLRDGFYHEYNNKDFNKFYKDIQDSVVLKILNFI